MSTARLEVLFSLFVCVSMGNKIISFGSKLQTLYTTVLLTSHVAFLKEHSFEILLPDLNL